MRPEIFLPLAFLFIACGVPSNAQSEGEATTTAAAPAEAAAGVRAGPGAVAGAAAGAGAAADGDVVLYEVGRTFTLNCSSGALSYVWKKNATALESVWELAERYELDENGGVFRLTKRSVEDDFGNYTCEPAGGATRTFVVRGRPHAKLPSDTNVVEDTKLKIVCRVTGKPHPGVTWSFNNDTAAAAEGAPGLEVRAALGDRVTLAPNEQGVPDAELVVEAAQRSDAGVYTCTPAPAGPGAGAASTPAATTLRVKDKYAALWPFLGICAEVFVLCAIILVYEKRRTKPELDDSDTDNHDQKKS